MALTDEKLTPVLDIIGNKEAIAVNQDWAGHPGLLVETFTAPPVPYDPSGATVNSSSPLDFGLSGGARITHGHTDAATSGASIRTGGPGQVSRIQIGSGLIGEGHQLDAVHLQFRYEAGYTPAEGQHKAAATVRLLLADVDSGAEVRELWASEPLGNYSYDDFKGFSPPVVAAASGLAQPNDTPLALVLEVQNNERNLQIPVDDHAAGMQVKVTWAAAGGTAAAPPVPFATKPAAPTVGAAPVAGQLWAKKLSGGGAAALLINRSPQPMHYALHLTKLNLTATAHEARDLWAHKDLGAVTDSLKLEVPAWDSAFVTLKPTK